MEWGDSKLSTHQFDITDVVQYVTCPRRFYLSVHIPKIRVSSSIIKQTCVIIEKFCSMSAVTLHMMYPETSDHCDPIFGLQHDGRQILVWINIDTIVDYENTPCNDISMYACAQWKERTIWVVHVFSGRVDIFEYEDIPSSVSLEDRLQDIRCSIQPPSVKKNIEGCAMCPVFAICLPHLEHASPTIRTLLPPKETTLPLYVDVPLGKIKKNKGELIVENKEAVEVQRYRFHEISSIVLFGIATITTPVLHECSERGISVHYHDIDGWYQGSFQPITGHNIMARFRQYQVAMNTQSCLSIVRNMIVTKIHNCHVFLRKSMKTMSAPSFIQYKNDAMSSASLEELRGIEGNVARLYFAHFVGMFTHNTVEFTFTHRNRRPPLDPVNAMLSFGYACLYREVIYATQQLGLDPYIGFLHVPQSGKASLALDIMEEFRAIIVDAIVIDIVNNKRLQKDDFVITPKGVWFSPSAKGTFLRYFERKMQAESIHPQLHIRLSYRRIIQVQVQLLIKALTQMHVQYTGFMIK